MTQTWVLGPLGLLLAIPATLLLMVVLVDVDPLGWVATLLRTPPRAGRRRLSPFIASRMCHASRRRKAMGEQRGSGPAA
jgi:hypothetical protein